MRTENLCQTGVWKGSDSEQQPKKTSRTRNSAAQQEHKTHGASQTCTSGGGRRPTRAEFLEKVIKLGTQKSRLNFHAGTRKTVFFSFHGFPVITSFLFLLVRFHTAVRCGRGVTQTHVPLSFCCEPASRLLVCGKSFLLRVDNSTLVSSWVSVFCKQRSERARTEFDR